MINFFFFFFFWLINIFLLNSLLNFHFNYSIFISQAPRVCGFWLCFLAWLTFNLIYCTIWSMGSTMIHQWVSQVLNRVTLGDILSSQHSILISGTLVCRFNLKSMVAWHFKPKPRNWASRDAAHVTDECCPNYLTMKR